MKVKLVSYSQPTEEFSSVGIDNVQELIAYCARVSNPANQLNTETSERLIKYLIKHAENKLSQVFGPIAESKESQEAIRLLEDYIQKNPNLYFLDYITTMMVLL